VIDADVEHAPGAQGLVVFAHGSGSSRRSPRNLMVAQRLHAARLSTVLFDLLTPAEQRADAVDASLRFDIDLLGERLTAVVEEVAASEVAPNPPIGVFGASTGAAAALMSAAARPDLVRSVVSRGGRPDLAVRALPRVQAPTLLIVGERDTQVLELNRRAAQEMNCLHELSVVPGATHLFEEPGTLGAVADRAADWFTRTLVSKPL
jgi:pimeloyl-ACP methyl ester carboxylesterase